MIMAKVRQLLLDRVQMTWRHDHTSTKGVSLFYFAQFWISVCLFVCVLSLFVLNFCSLSDIWLKKRWYFVSCLTLDLKRWTETSFYLVLNFLFGNGNFSFECQSYRLNFHTKSRDFEIGFVGLVHSFRF